MSTSIFRPFGIEVGANPLKTANLVTKSFFDARTCLLKPTLLRVIKMVQKFFDERWN
jgi:hypothetical protein